MTTENPMPSTEPKTEETPCVQPSKNPAEMCSIEHEVHTNLGSEPAAMSHGKTFTDQPVMGEFTAKPEAKPADATGQPGRPSLFTPELADEIALRLGDGEPLRQICRDAHMPHWTTVYAWMERDAAFKLRIAHAREAGADAIAEEALEIADTPQKGIITKIGGKNGPEVTEEDMLGHRKLQVETRLKLLSKWAPKKYGDRITHANDPENPMPSGAQVNIGLTPEQLKAEAEKRGLPTDVFEK
jgi:hypothetical protein